MEGIITAKEEFLYPDSPLGPLPADLRLAMARNGKPGLQVLLGTVAFKARLRLEGDAFTAEWFQMRPVPVEYNTGDGVSQGGAMVLETPPAQKPAYATRLAPFRVYDCLEPREDGEIDACEGRVAAYLCLRAADGVNPGEHAVRLIAECGGEMYACTLNVRVYDVEIPVDAFQTTTWFSLGAIERCHGVKGGTQAYLEQVRRYARLMRRMHQTMFYLDLGHAGRACAAPEDFDALRPVAQIFFEEGMRRMELGPLLSRGERPDGSPDMYTDSLKCACAPQLAIDSHEGYARMVSYIKALSAFLQKNGWADKAVFHVLDEPDIHVKDEAALLARRRQYYLAVSVLRKYIPGAKVIEAVDSAAFIGGVDIWVPGTAGYESQKEAFDNLTALGEEVWNYVCCGPQGQWLNRFLDFAVIKTRLLFWGFSKNRVCGFLHWGFNQFPEGMDPFEATACPNPTGIGTSFPCGDAFICYPGPDGPWPGLRLEAQRRGVEDAALLGLVRERDAALHGRLVSRVFTDNAHYDARPEALEAAFEDALAYLEGTGLEGTGA